MLPSEHPSADLHLVSAPPLHLLPSRSPALRQIFSQLSGDVAARVQECILPVTTCVRQHRAAHVAFLCQLASAARKLDVLLEGSPLCLKGPKFLWDYLEAFEWLSLDEVNHWKQEMQRTRSLWDSDENCEWWMNGIKQGTLHVQSCQQLKHLHDACKQMTQDQQRKIWQSILSKPRTAGETKLALGLCLSARDPVRRIASSTPIGESAPTAEACRRSTRIEAAGDDTIPVSLRAGAAFASPALVGALESTARITRHSTPTTTAESSTSAAPGLRSSSHRIMRTAAPGPSTRTVLKPSTSSDSTVIAFARRQRGHSSTHASSAEHPVRNSSTQADSANPMNASHHGSSVAEQRPTTGPTKIKELHFATSMSIVLPLHPVVRTVLEREGAVAVLPCAADRASFLSALNPLVREPAYLTSGLSMTLGCGNVNGFKTAEPLANEIDSDGLWRAVPDAERVWSFIESDWAKAKAGTRACTPEDMSNRIYFKDVSQENGSDFTQGKFFPSFERSIPLPEGHALQVDDDEEPACIVGTEAEFMQHRRSLRRGFEKWQGKDCIHPLFMSELKLHRSVLANLMTVAFDGVAGSYYLYVKTGFQFFNLHIEQMLFTFVHHQLEGESLWILIPYGQLQQLYKLAAEMYKTLYQEQDDETSAVMGRALLYSKQLFPPLSLLRQHGIQWIEKHLKAGEVLLAHGGWAHYGFSTARGQTISVATNVMTEHWLADGLPFLQQHFDWVRALSSILPQAKANAKPTGDMHSVEEMVQHALKLCPSNVTCSLMRGLLADLELIRLKREPVGAYPCLLPEDLPIHMARARDVLRMVHELRDFISRSQRVSCRSRLHGVVAAIGNCVCELCLCASNPDPSVLWGSREEELVHTDESTRVVDPTHDRLDFAPTNGSTVSAMSDAEDNPRDLEAPAAVATGYGVSRLPSAPPYVKDIKQCFQSREFAFAAQRAKSFADHLMQEFEPHRKAFYSQQLFIREQVGAKQYFMNASVRDSQTRKKSYKTWTAESRRSFEALVAGFATEADVFPEGKSAKDYHVQDVKILESHPGRGAQIAHFDSDENPDVQAKVFTVLLFLTDGTDGTAVPTFERGELPVPKFAKRGGVEVVTNREELQKAHKRGLLNNESYMCWPVQRGDMLMFQQSMMHFGTRNPLAKGLRRVLVAVYTSRNEVRQDDLQMARPFYINHAYGTESRETADGLYYEDTLGNRVLDVIDRGTDQGQATCEAMIRCLLRWDYILWKPRTKGTKLSDQIGPMGSKLSDQMEFRKPLERPPMNQPLDNDVVQDRYEHGVRRER